MSNRIIFTGLIVSLLLHLFAGEASGQNRIDSIQAEVKALKESYNEQMTALYYEMLELTQSEALPVWEQNRAKTLFHIFSNEESIAHIVENIHVQWFQREKGERTRKQPYYTSLMKVINTNGQEYPAIMEKLLMSLDESIDSYEEYFRYAQLFRAFLYTNVSQSLSTDDMAACLRMIANSIIGVSVRKQNLLKIAEILDRL